jgi:hypothetical protein
MGDASQANFDPLIEELNPAHHVDSRPSPVGSEQEEQQELLLNRLAVIYSHSSHVTPKDFPRETCVVCQNFDALLLLLEDDQVDELWFDETVSPHESSYILGWARIFRPGLTAQKLQRSRIAN